MSDTTALSVEQIRDFIEITPLAKLMGIRLESWDDNGGVLTCCMEMRPELCNHPKSGTYHGGAIATLLDTATCFAIIGKGHKRVPTTNIRVDYLRPAVNTGLKCVATIRRCGRTAATVDADVLNDDGKLVAIGRCNLQILP